MARYHLLKEVAYVWWAQRASRAETKWWMVADENKMVETVARW